MTGGRWYKGCSVSRVCKHGAQFHWESYVDGGGFLYADTLAGLKELITEALRKVTNGQS
jgi:hypothetical protein